MQNPLREVGSIDLYEKKGPLKWVITGIAALIALASLWYTNNLVSSLKEREQKTIDLFAKTIEYTIQESNSTNILLLFQEIIVSNEDIPVIRTDEAGYPVEYKNLKLPDGISEEEKEELLFEELDAMREEHEPIPITYLDENGREGTFGYVYYQNSFTLTQLQYYPFVQLSVIAVFGLLAYLAFNFSKRAEQNRVWVGLAKETAHQLGTPLSSLMAWLEYMRADEKLYDHEIVSELEKDIYKLEMITSRFSNIGSVPVLKEESVPDIIHSTVSYLQKRISRKVQWTVTSHPASVEALMNRPLFDWVIENLCKNAVDAMDGTGKISISILKGNDNRVFVDVTDTGKGIPKNKVRQVFNPGYTTKRRGWGLGLTLVKRIVENYHGGRIYVKSSEPGKGTSFRIVLQGTSNGVKEAVS
ncbi:PAS domain-containing sensor histidine kinase [Roseivirga sp. BDSF3-8]|uniref:sensor histidine kinase n=1 Tax=Roseivirga sp. BDSF3-8 TaxID=3241598 RepID=UPI003531FF21